MCQGTEVKQNSLISIHWFNIIASSIEDLEDETERESGTRNKIMEGILSLIFRQQNFYTEWFI